LPAFSSVPRFVQPTLRLERRLPICHAGHDGPLALSMQSCGSMHRPRSGQWSGETEGRAPRGDPVWVLLSADDRQLSEIIAEVLRCDGHRVVEVYDGVAVLLNLMALGFDPVSPGVAVVVVCDGRLPVGDGLAILRNFEDHENVGPPLVLVTDAESAAGEAEAGSLDAVEVLIKPFVVEDLRRLVWRRQHVLAERRSRTSCPGSTSVAGMAGCARKLEPG
jgi:CheY-like chemotaxis protein